MWSEKALKELRGKDLSEIYVDLDLGDPIPPIQLSEQVGKLSPIEWPAAEDGFKYLSEIKIEKNNETAANQKMIDELNGGAEIVYLDLSHVDDLDLMQLMENVIPSYIAVWIKGANQSLKSKFQAFNKKTPFSVLLILDERNYIQISGELDQYKTSL